jgi:hypothetical protein
MRGAGTATEPSLSQDWLAAGCNHSLTGAAWRRPQLRLCLPTGRRTARTRSPRPRCFSGDGAADELLAPELRPRVDRPEASMLHFVIVLLVSPRARSLSAGPLCHL